MNDYVVKNDSILSNSLFLIVIFSNISYANGNEIPSRRLTQSVADTAPVVSNFRASSNSDGFVSGSITVSHEDSTLDTLRIHYCNSSSYNCGDQFVDLRRRTGTRSFSFDASKYAGQRVYYKAEVKSAAGTQTLPPPSGSVRIPESDSAPIVTNFNASANSDGTVSGSITVNHSTLSLSELRIHYCNSSSYNCGNQYIDLNERTGTHQFSFNASQYAGERVYYKAEVISAAGTQTLPPPSGSVRIPESDSAPIVTNFNASANSDGTVSGSITVNHSTLSLSELRIHYCNSSSYNCGNQYIDLNERTGTHQFSFNASQYAGERVYYKAEVISAAGTQTLPPPSGSVRIPESDSAPIVTNFNASANSDGTVSGSITVNHSTSSLNELRIHYCNSSSYNCGNQYIDLDERTGTHQFNFDAIRYAGQRVYYKAEVISAAGTQTLPPPSGSVNIPQVTLPSVSDFSPKQIAVGATKTVVISGQNLPSTIVANIHGSDSCTRQSVSSTQAAFSCSPTVAGEQRFYVKAQSGDANFIAGSESWTITVTEDNTPSVSDFSPKQIAVGSIQTVVISGQNLPSTIVANIHGSDSCARQSVSSTQAAFSCSPTVAGEQRFYVKAQSGDANFIAGSESWTITVIEDNTPSVSDFSPKQIAVGSTQTVVISGQNLPSTIVANIHGSDSCARQSVSSTQVAFSCSPTVAGEQRFYVKAQSGDANFIAGSESWTITVTEDNTPSVSDFSPKQIAVGSTQTVVISGQNLPSTIVANIHGSDSCARQSVSSTQAAFSCSPTVAGEQRFYVKAQSGDANFIAGSESWFIEIQETQGETSTLTVNTSGRGKVVSSPTNEIDCGSRCSYQYENNRQITLIATAEDGWEFSSWSYQPTQANQCTAVACSLVVTEDLLLTAVFVEQEDPTTEPRLIDFTPKRASKGSETTFTLVGENLPTQLIANIQGTLGHCTYINGNESRVTLTCSPDEQGSKRFYIKDANDRSKPLTGSEHWHVEITPPIQNSTPSVWIENLPSYATLGKQFTVVVKSEDIDGDLVSIQADWEGDNNLDRKVNVSNTHGQDIAFSYTRSNNDTSELTIKFIATDASGNKGSFSHKIPVVEPQNTTEVVSGYEGSDKVISTDGGQCVANPIIPSNGAKVESKQLLAVNGVVPVTFDISYNSLIRGQSGIGVGWDFANAYAAQIAEQPNGEVTILWSDNQQHKFSPKGDGTYNTESFGCRLDKLTKLEDGTFKVERRNRLTYIFNEFNFLTRIENHKGQGINFEFDEQSRLKKAYEPVSNVGITYNYNNDGFLVEASTNAGRSVRLSYENEQLTQITHADGTIEEFTYNSLDQIVEHFLDSVLVSTTKYDNRGRATEQEDSRDDNQVLLLSYQETDEHVITTITDRNGAITQKTFDKNYQLLKEVNALSHEQKFEYNEDGKPTLITNGRGFSTSMEYTLYGDITKLKTPDGAIDKKVYDTNRNILKHTNALEEDTVYSYVTGTNNVETITNALELKTSFTYNEHSQQLSITTPEGRTTHYGYSNGLLTSETTPEGYTRHIYYDLDGFVNAETDFQGNTTTYERDGLGRVVRKVDPLGQVETWVYDARGNVTEYCDKRCNSGTSSGAAQLLHSYNGQGDLIEKRIVSINQSFQDIVYKYKYDGESRLIESADPNGNVTKIKRDPLGRVTETTDALGNTVKAEFDENGNLIESSDAKGNISKATFDNMDRAEQSEDALGKKQLYEYNLLGQITKATNALSQVWHNAYDELSRLVSITHPSSEEEPLVAKQGYDKDNNVISVTAPADDTRKLALNNNAQVETETTADDVSLKYSYNENGLVKTFSNGRSQQTRYEYDIASRLTSVTDSISTISYGYDQNANPTNITENSLTVTREYDSLNRVSLYKQNDNNYRGVNFLRDSAGNLEQVQYINDNGNTNLPVKYTYNALNLVTSVSALNQDVIAAQYEYDANRNVTKVIRGNGTVLENIYDELNRLTISVDKAPDGSEILRQEYTYNAIGQLTKEDVEPEFAPPVELLAKQAMVYSADNRIVSKNSKTFDFDLDGNTLNVGDMALDFNARNQLSSAGNHQYTYNAEGMRDTQTYSGNSGETSIRYSLLPDYLGLPQIAWQEVTHPDDSKDQHFFIYSPYGLVSQRSQKHDEGAQEYYFHYDYRGSVVAISDENGEVVARYGYTPFGQRIDAPNFAEQNKAIETPFGYNGRDGVITDSNGLIYMRARYYSPELRRFVSKDPIRGDISDLGSLNRYAYVGGDPVNLVDPSGKKSGTLVHFGQAESGVGKYEYNSSCSLTDKNCGPTFDYSQLYGQLTDSVGSKVFNFNGSAKVGADGVDVGVGASIWELRCQLPGGSEISIETLCVNAGFKFKYNKGKISFKPPLVLICPDIEVSLESLGHFGEKATYPVKIAIDESANKMSGYNPIDWVIWFDKQVKNIGGF